MVPTSLAFAGEARRAPGALRPGRLSAFIVTAGLAAALIGSLTYAYLRKDITVVVSGRTVKVTTFRRTVGQALAQAHITVRGSDEVSPPLQSRLWEGQTVVVRRAVPVTLKLDGKIIRLASAAPTVAELLHRRRVSVGRSDKVFPSPDAPLARNATIRVVRIQHRLVVEQSEIPYNVRTSADPLIPRGIVRVRAPGRVGLKERVFKVTLADKRVVRRELVGERVVRSPLDRVITIGSQVQIASRGLFAGRETLDMVATAYSPWCCRGVDNVTAIGILAGYGVVAVDPTVIPLGSRLYIEGYGYAIAGDTGSRIKGLRVDLGFATKREAIRFGRRPVRVYIIVKKEKKAKGKRG